MGMNEADIISLSPRRLKYIIKYNLSNRDNKERMKLRSDTQLVMLIPILHVLMQLDVYVLRGDASKYDLELHAIREKVAASTSLNNASLNKEIVEKFIGSRSTEQLETLSMYMQKKLPMFDGAYNVTKRDFTPDKLLMDYITLKVTARRNGMITTDDDITVTIKEIDGVMHVVVYRSIGIDYRETFKEIDYKVGGEVRDISIVDFIVGDDDPISTYTDSFELTSDYLMFVKSPDVSEEEYEDEEYDDSEDNDDEDSEDNNNDDSEDDNNDNSEDDIDDSEDDDSEDDDYYEDAVEHIVYVNVSSKENVEDEVHKDGEGDDVALDKAARYKELLEKVNSLLRLEITSIVLIIGPNNLNLYGVDSYLPGVFNPVTIAKLDANKFFKLYDQTIDIQLPDVRCHMHAFRTRILVLLKAFRMACEMTSYYEGMSNKDLGHILRTLTGKKTLSQKQIAEYIDSLNDLYGKEYEAVSRMSSERVYKDLIEIVKIRVGRDKEVNKLLKDPSKKKRRNQRIVNKVKDSFAAKRDDLVNNKMLVKGEVLKNKIKKELEGGAAVLQTSHELVFPHDRIPYEVDKEREEPTYIIKPYFIDTGYSENQLIVNELGEEYDVNSKAPIRVYLSMSKSSERERLYDASLRTISNYDMYVKSLREALTEGCRELLFNYINYQLRSNRGHANLNAYSKRVERRKMKLDTKVPGVDMVDRSDQIRADLKLYGEYFGKDNLIDNKIKVTYAYNDGDFRILEKSRYNQRYQLLLKNYIPKAEGLHPTKEGDRRKQINEFRRFKSLMDSGKILYGDPKRISHFERLITEFEELQTLIPILLGRCLTIYQASTPLIRPNPELYSKTREELLKSYGIVIINSNHNTTLIAPEAKPHRKFKDVIDIKLRSIPNRIGVVEEHHMLSKIYDPVDSKLYPILIVTLRVTTIITFIIHNDLIRVILERRGIQENPFILYNEVGFYRNEKNLSLKDRWSVVPKDWYEGGM